MSTQPQGRISAQHRPRIAVVGAGVVGLSTAVCLAETFGQQLDITVIAERFSPNLTSNRAGAYFFMGVGDPKERGEYLKFEAKYGPPTFHRFKFLYESCDSDEIGIHPILMYCSFEKGSTAQCTSVMRKLCPEYGDISLTDAKDLLKLPSRPVDDFSSIEIYKTLTIQPAKYLNWLIDQFRRSGGVIIQHKVGSLNELQNYDVIMNCTGLEARKLVGDTSIYPVRGQMVMVHAPQVGKELRLNYGPKSYQYTIPQGDGKVLMGGMPDAHEWSTTYEVKKEAEIIERCTAIDPALKGAKVIGGWVGLRPARKTVRFEVEDDLVGPAVVHNYGHGCNGFILSWGTAIEACRLASQCLLERGIHLSPLSKL